MISRNSQIGFCCSLALYPNSQLNVEWVIRSQEVTIDLQDQVAARARLYGRASVTCLGMQLALGQLVRKDLEVMILLDRIY
jgi:hypothetical protein